MKNFFQTRSAAKALLSSLPLLFLSGNLPAFSQACVPSTGITLTWSTMAPMPTAREFFATDVINNIIYSVGGFGGSSTFATLESYDPATNTWATLADRPLTASGPAAASLNGLLYAIGGLTAVPAPDAEMDAYNPATNSWTTLAPLPMALFNLGAGVISGKIYAVGGANGAVVNSLYSYDPGTNIWTTLAPMPTSRSNLGVAVVNGILYAIGGYTAPGFLNTLEAYDPVTNSWTTLAPMPTAREGFSVSVINGIIYAVGGFDGVTRLNIVEVYDPATNAWTTLTAPMPTGRVGLTGAAVNGVLYEFGGYSGVLQNVTEAAVLICGPLPTPTMTATPSAFLDVFTVDKNTFTVPVDKTVNITVGYSKFPGQYSLSIYNTAGEHIQTLDSRVLTSTLNQTYTWDGTNKNGEACASGVYVIYLVEPFARKVKRIALVR